ncbi:hypothetical protein IQ249_07385 [Lusitaniella coriacea LEGE 07157]|uniref:Uncharacterized protein n=1 Tax=Lusitaniella coriacea LEGE 07157 TaxID=945747 RepID=A0A8J7DVV5_9CYAN|nr:hypothetical protein [Lusitaniella coriacea]MBE9115713.1 hypothetical protein [Lusitaniella coriacea LEGE 07157]
MQPEIPLDPLDSPYPIPWNWVIATHAEFNARRDANKRCYRSPSLISPDGQYAAYSRLQMESNPEVASSRITSIMFLENLQTGDLRTVTASSPLADNPFGESEDAQLPGILSILIPVSWSQNGDRLLARQFEGLFNTSEASDYAVVWERRTGKTYTLFPGEVEYTNAVLLGWSQAHSDRVLFRAGSLGEEDWPLWAVNLAGETELACEDCPIVYGQVRDRAWTGPQG